MEVNELILVIAGVIVLGALVFFAARNEIVKRRLACPHKGEDAEVEVKRRFEGGKPVRVESCTLLDDPTHVTCDEACIKHEPAEQ